MPYEFTTNRYEGINDLFVRITGALDRDEVAKVTGFLSRKGKIRFLFLDSRKLESADPDALFTLENCLADLSRKGVRVVISDGRIRISLEARGQTVN